MQHRRCGIAVGVDDQQRDARLAYELFGAFGVAAQPEQVFAHAAAHRPAALHDVVHLQALRQHGKAVHRAVGEHPKAADTVGINVAATRWSAVLVGSIFAGLGGAFFTIGFAGAFNKDITVGNGFIALAALIMGRWRPVLAALMALFFGFVTQMASQLQTINTPMPSQFLLILPYIATIIAVAGLVGRVRPPAADGVPYIKEGH